jgi:hypothetical protein
MNWFSRGILLLTVLCLISFKSSAQDEIAEYLEGNVNDAEKLLGAYVSPAMKAISLGMNQGWYNTAKAHKTFGVDLTFTANLMRVPDDELWFKPNDILGADANIHLDETSPNYPNAPTMFGPEGDQNTPLFTVTNGDGTTEPLEGAPGVLDIKKEIGSTIVPVPMLTLGIGVSHGTDLKLRFIPEQTLGDDGKMKMFGVGVMHDVKQWIPGMKNLPFELSGFIGFNKLTVEVPIDNDTYSDQRGEFAVTGTTIQGIISKKISVLTLYGSAGYNIAKSKLAMKGTYDIGKDESGETITMKDPINIQTAASGPRLGAGFRLKLAILTLHLDYTLQKYSCITAGVGLSVR